MQSEAVIKRLSETKWNIVWNVVFIMLENVEECAKFLKSKKRFSQHKILIHYTIKKIVNA